MQPARLIEPTRRVDDRIYIERLIRRLAAQCPQRVPGSRDERRAQSIIRHELRRFGGTSHWQRFVFSSNLYAVIGLHFAIAALALGLLPVDPLLAAGVHLLVALSYVGDSRRWGYWLRRLLPWRQSQNLLVTFPARRRLRKRIVVAAHADAAYTGWLFQPWITGLGGGTTFPRPLRILGKPLLLATLGLVAVAGMEVDMWLRGTLWPRFPVLYVLCHVFFATVAILNLQIAWRREVVPGANDNLSGCAALPVLARRMVQARTDDVEWVFVVTGSEEAGTGGALALARRMRKAWDPSLTDFVVLDSLSGGSLVLYQEGELLAMPIPSRLRSQAEGIAAADSRFADLRVFPLPAGATDATAFLAGGYEAVALGCVDEKLGSPRHYHLPGDSPENLDYDRLMVTIDFAEQLMRTLAGLPPSHSVEKSKPAPAPLCVLPDADRR